MGAGQRTAGLSLHPMLYYALYNSDLCTSTHCVIPSMSAIRQKVPVVHPSRVVWLQLLPAPAPSGTAAGEHPSRKLLCRVHSHSIYAVWQMLLLPSCLPAPMLQTTEGLYMILRRSMAIASISCKQPVCAVRHEHSLGFGTDDIAHEQIVDEEIDDMHFDLDLNMPDAQKGHSESPQNLDDNLEIALDILAFLWLTPMISRLGCVKMKVKLLCSTYSASAVAVAVLPDPGSEAES